MTAAARVVLGDDHGDIVDCSEPACTRYVEEPPRSMPTAVRVGRATRERVLAYICIETGEAFASARDFWEATAGTADKPADQPALWRAARDGLEVCGVHVRTTTVSGARAVALCMNGWAPAKTDAAC